MNPHIIDIGEVQNYLSEKWIPLARSKGKYLEAKFDGKRYRLTLGDEEHYFHSLSWAVLKYNEGLI